MLNNRTLNTTEIVIDYPGTKNFKVRMKYIPREELLNLRTESLTQTYNRTTRKHEETVDTEKFMDAYIKMAIVGWSGLTLGIASKLVPIEVAESEKDTEIPYSHDDALWLVRQSSEFDNFVSETMSRVENFSVTKKAEQQKK